MTGLMGQRAQGTLTPEQQLLVCGLMAALLLVTL
jgi:hypothetical protein